MLDFLKIVGYSLLALGGFCLAHGIGAVVTALSAVLSTVLLGGAVILVIVLMVKELLDSNK